MTVNAGRKRSNRERAMWSVGIAALTVLTGWTVVKVSAEPTAPAEATPPVLAAHGGGAAPGAVPASAPPMPVVTSHCPRTAAACVDERLRISWLQRDGKITYGPVPVMPGTAGAADAVATPKGIFHVQWKDAHHVSSEFPEAMPNAVFFAAGGIAFHEGSLVSASHGCVHLSPEASERYFHDLSIGAEVAVS